jgi:septal ring factor EnvC (AmiA/AmiB activator)
MYQKKTNIAESKAMLDYVEHTPVSKIETELLASSDVILKELAREMAARITSEENIKKTELERLQKAYSARSDEIHEEIVRKRRADIEKEIQKQEAEIATATEQQKIVQEEVAQLKKEVERFDVSSIDMAMKREDIASMERMLNHILDEIEKLQIALHTGPRVTIVEKAEMPE